MPSLNSVILVGNVTRDIELRHIGSGTAVCDLGLAVNDRVKKGDQWVDTCDFIDVTLWGRTAEVASEYLSKGSSVLITGKLRLESWEKDGKKFSKLKVVGENMQMLGSKPAAQAERPQGVNPHQAARANAAAVERGDDSVPF